MPEPLPRQGPNPVRQGLGKCGVGGQLLCRERRRGMHSCTPKQGRPGYLDPSGKRRALARTPACCSLTQKRLFRCRQTDPGWTFCHKFANIPINAADSDIWMAARDKANSWPFRARHRSMMPRMGHADDAPRACGGFKIRAVSDPCDPTRFRTTLWTRLWAISCAAFVGPPPRLESAIAAPGACRSVSGRIPRPGPAWQARAVSC